MLGPEAGEGADLLLFAGAFEIFEGGDAEGLDEDGDGFGSEAVDVEHFEGGGGVAFEEFVATVKGAAGFDFFDDAGDAFADAGDIGELTGGVGAEGGEAFAVAFDDSGGVAVAANAEAVFGGDLHQVGGFAEELGDLNILHTQYCLIS